jgi:hypothetical protein
MNQNLLQEVAFCIYQLILRVLLFLLKDWNEDELLYRNFYRL